MMYLFFDYLEVFCAYHTFIPMTTYASHPRIQLSSSDEPHLQSISGCTLGSKMGISESQYLHIL